MMKKYFALFFILPLLMACNMSKDNAVATIEVENLTDFDRTIETIEVEWKAIEGEQVSPDSVIVVDEASGGEIPSQVCYDMSGEPEMLVFQVQMDKKTSASYLVKKATPQAYESKVYGAVYSSRYNDFAWENDVVAFRVYQESLIPIDGPSGGVDVWSKRTNVLILDKWFAHGHYHTDHGEGCDFYKVGPTLGAGGFGFVYDGKLIQHSNYITSKVIANGPVRFQALLSFPAVLVGDKTITLSKMITLDAGQNLNKFDIYLSEPCTSAQLAAGIVLRPEGGDVKAGEEDGFLAYWQPENKEHGFTGVGIVAEAKTKAKVLEVDNHVVMASSSKDKSFSYYAGACWSKADNAGSPLVSPNSKEGWESYLVRYAQQVKQPLSVKVIR